MITLAQRIEALRGEKGLGQASLSLALGFPKNAIEKFESGRQTPSKAQQEKMATYFGVSIFYLLGESNDRTRQEDWLDMSMEEIKTAFVPQTAPKSAKVAKAEEAPGNFLDSVLVSKQAKEVIRAHVLETLKSPEGQAIIEKAVQKALLKLK